MSEKKERFIGFRVSLKEFNKIERMRIEMNEKMTLTEFIRTSIFSHIYALQHTTTVFDISTLQDTNNQLLSIHNKFKSLLNGGDIRP